MSIPLFDCRVDSGGVADVDRVLRSGRLAGGAEVAALETELSARVCGRPVVALSDMTQALEIALRLAGITPGDKVLTLSYNCLSSNLAIHRIGAVPVWVDIDPATASMDVSHAQSLIRAGAQALVAYHVAGYPADAASLRALCDEAGLAFVEDANNALAAVLPGGAPAGVVGDFAVFSFYANRQVSGIEGAALVCADERSAAKARQLRRFGIEQSRFRDATGEIDPAADVPTLGLPASMADVNAVLARHNLALLDERLRIVRANAASMVAALEEVPGITPVQPIAGGIPAYWGLLLSCSERDRLLHAFKTAGISCSKLHQPNHVYSGFGVDEALLPGTARFMESILAVPCGWWVGPEERQKIIDVAVATQSAYRT